MPRLLCPRVLVLCGVALLGLSGCLGSTPRRSFTFCRPAPAATRCRRHLRASVTSRWGSAR